MRYRATLDHPDYRNMKFAGLTIEVEAKSLQNAFDLATKAWVEENTWLTVFRHHVTVREIDT